MIYALVSVSLPSFGNDLRVFVLIANHMHIGPHKHGFRGMSELLRFKVPAVGSGGSVLVPSLFEEFLCSCAFLVAYVGTPLRYEMYA